MTANANILAWSRNPDGDELITVELTYWRALHSELMTYGMLAKSSASSRAVSFEKMLKSVKDNPFIPEFLGYEQRGMQSGNEMYGEDRIAVEDLIWKIHNFTTEALQEYIDQYPKERRVHKSILNRYLEPCMYHTAIFTGNTAAWGNVFSQRIHPDAEKHMNQLCLLFKEQMSLRKPKELKWGDWHLPFLEDNKTLSTFYRTGVPISTARCARASYMTHDGEINPEADIDLYNKLVTAEPKHLSPMEHPAMAEKGWAKTQAGQGKFTGFRQHRWEVERGLSIGEPTEDYVRRVYLEYR